MSARALDSVLEGEDNGQSVKPPLLRTTSKPLQNVDDLYNKLGNPGRLQVIWLLLLACNLFTVSPNGVVGVFFGFSPTHFCNASFDWSDLAETSNRSPDITSHNNSRFTDRGNQNNLTSRSLYSGFTVNRRSAEMNNSGLSPGSVRYGECSVNLTFVGEGIPLNASKKCHRGEWVYELSGREATTVTDFDLVCDSEYMTHLASTLYYLGLMLANITLGYASDVVGRRPVVLLTLHLILLTGLGVAFANSFIMFAALRVVMGMLSQSLQSASFILAIELFPVHHRGQAGGVIQVFWGLGCLYVSVVAWLAQDWRLIQLVMLVPTAVCALCMWYVGESLRWLLAKGKTKPASLAVRRIAKFNKMADPIHGDDHSVLAEYKVHYVKEHSSYFALFRTREMRRRTIFLSLVVFGVNLGYFGMTYNNAELAGDRYLNFFLGSVTELVAYASGVFVVVKFGRRKTLFACLLFGSVCCLVSGVIPRSGDINNVFVTIFSVLGRFAIAACYCASDTFVAELFPTVLRNTGVGVCTFVGRLGSALSPQISALVQWWFCYYQKQPGNTSRIQWMTWRATSVGRVQSMILQRSLNCPSILEWTCWRRGRMMKTKTPDTIEKDRLLRANQKQSSDHAPNKEPKGSYS